MTKNGPATAPAINRCDGSANDAPSRPPQPADPEHPPRRRAPSVPPGPHRVPRRAPPRSRLPWVERSPRQTPSRRAQSVGTLSAPMPVRIESECPTWTMCRTTAQRAARAPSSPARAPEQHRRGQNGRRRPQDLSPAPTHQPQRKHRHTAVEDPLWPRKRVRARPRIPANQPPHRRGPSAQVKRQKPS